MDLAQPEKPLKILTLDGGGLQGISTLLILNKLLYTIQENNKAATKPRPCDVFDVITGIGAGGWLALLLGRLRLDIETCLTEWYELIQCIAPRSRSQGLRRRVLTHSYFDENLLVKEIDRLTDLYGTGNKLYNPQPDNARCKYVFVAAAQKGSKGNDAEDYNLFRTYAVDDNHEVLAGPRDPASFTIARAFGATGAARYFSAPWKEHIAADGKTSFLDSAFPRPHNITLLALKEMWTLYGPQVPISVIVNIGSGIPTDADLNQIARRFSWGLKTPGSKGKRSSQLRLSTATNKSSSPSRDSQKYGPWNRKFQEEESDLEARIEKELKTHYTVTPPYFRLSLDSAPQGTAQNDARKPGAVLDAFKQYRKSPGVMTKMNDICSIIETNA